MSNQRKAAPPVTGQLARALAATLDRHGYQVQFPPGRDPAVFKVTGLPGDPNVEVTAEEDGSTGCFYTGQTAAGVAELISRLSFPAPEDPNVQLVTWDDIAVEWNYLPPDDEPASVEQVAALLLPHLAVLSGRPG